MGKEPRRWGLAYGSRDGEIILDRVSGLNLIRTIPGCVQRNMTREETGDSQSMTRTGSTGIGFGGGRCGVWAKECVGCPEPENNLQPRANKKRRSSVFHKDMYFAKSLAELSMNFPAEPPDRRPLGLTPWFQPYLWNRNWDLRWATKCGGNLSQDPQKINTHLYNHYHLILVIPGIHSLWSPLTN